MTSRRAPARPADSSIKEKAVSEGRSITFESNQLFPIIDEKPESIEDIPSKKRRQPENARRFFGRQNIHVVPDDPQIMPVDEIPLRSGKLELDVLDQIGWHAAADADDG
jgi:hypothetical protein